MECCRALDGVYSSVNMHYSNVIYCIYPGVGPGITQTEGIVCLIPPLTDVCVCVCVCVCVFVDLYVCDVGM